MNRNHHLQTFAARLRQLMAGASEAQDTDAFPFNDLALELFRIQCDRNPAYRQLCRSRGLAPAHPEHWTAIPAVPTSAFKEWDLSCLPVEERTAVFFSSGTTGRRPSRTFHNRDSLTLYEASLNQWFAAHFPTGASGERIVALTPDLNQAPHSSLVHMFDTLRRERAPDEFTFAGEALPDGSWRVDGPRAVRILRGSQPDKPPLLLLGTAFSFVHLLDYLAAAGLKLQLPWGSRILETGGYKGRSRTLPKAELHAQLSEWMGVPESHMVCEYGMSELSSQAYDRRAPGRDSVVPASCGSPTEEKHRRDAGAPREFHFPPWVRVQIISPETGREVAAGETGLIRVLDLANVYSVLAIQTEDLAIRGGTGFELIGRATLAEPRGCSLMAG